MKVAVVASVQPGTVREKRAFDIFGVVSGPCNSLELGSVESWGW